jgi:hypothetical protein
MKMGTRTLVTAIIVSFFVAGCGPMMRTDGEMRVAHKEKANQCDGNGACTVDVKLSSDGTKIVVEPDYVIVNNKRKPIDIFFDPASGLTIESVDFGNTSGEFDPCMPVGGSGKFKCKDNHGSFGVYKYIVKVRNFTAVDPWVVND